MTDKEIIDHLRLRKYSSALKGLYGSLKETKKYILNNSGSADDAEDIFQDALVALCNKVANENFSLTVPLKTYLLAIVKNCWYQELRRRKKLPSGEVPHEIESMESDEEPGFVFAKAAFDLLGEKCRQLLIMFYYQQHSYKHIAATLSFSDERVAKNQKYRCLQKAKENYITLSKNVIHE